MSELRHRKQPSPGDGKSGKGDNSLVDAVPYLQNIAPYVGQTLSFVEMSILPFLHLAYDFIIKLWVDLKPYHPELLLPSLIGIIMCFFGGSYMTLIAAVEAYRLCGYEQSLKCLRNIAEDSQKFASAYREDDVKDDNHDGIADVLQISKQDLVKRKALLFFRTIDPIRLSEALHGLNSGFLAVVATLKLQFAKAITLGHAIGTIIERPALQYIVPTVDNILPSEYKKWAVPIVSYTMKSMAISLAWFLQRIITAFHSAIRGGHMFSRNILEYLSRMGYININHKETYLDEVLGYGMAVLGLWFQLSVGFKLPFPLNIIMFPVTIVEYLLQWFINFAK